VTVTSELDARLEIKAFVDRSRAPYSQWYVGIAADPDERLREHGLQEADWYIVRRLASAEAARRVAEALLKLECDGTAGGDETATAVYAYWKRGHTTP
jgi:predicted GIY-YIG superfamily endonuclease